jgi:hypothetical protein
MTQSQHCHNWQQFSKIFSKALSAGTFSSTSQGRREQTTCSTVPTNINFLNEAKLSNQVTERYSRTTSQHKSCMQLVITSEGGRTSGKACSTFEGSGADEQPFSQEFFPR